MAYLIVKYVHIVGVVLFLGNITTGLFWKRHADRSRDGRVILNALEGIERSDRWFTLPGVAVIITAGVIGAVLGRHPMLSTRWILWSIVLFSISGLAFGFRVAPLQRRMVHQIRGDIAKGEIDWPRYHALSRQWETWGAVSLLAPFAAAALMVLKP